MGLFRCSHYVPMKAMQDLTLEHAQVGPILDLQPGVVLRYVGFCRKCKALVSLVEEVPSRALHEYLERAVVKPSPEKVEVKP